MRRRKDREPSQAEISLWGEVARSVRPLSSRKLPLKKKPVLPIEDMASIEFEINSASENPGQQVAKPATGKSVGSTSSVVIAASSNKSGTLPKSPMPLHAQFGSKTPVVSKSSAVIGPLERKLRAALKRGTRPIEAVIDLHGMHQAEAHAALGAFLHRSSARGAGLVLVVTGKGAGKGAGKSRGISPQDGRELGILRRMVPHWLNLPEFRMLIIGFEEAHQNHGGAGALYVRLRRMSSSGGLA